MNTEDNRSLICVIWRLVVDTVGVAHTVSFECWHAVILTNEAAWPGRLARCRAEMNRSQCAELMILFCTLELPLSSKQKQPIIIDNMGMCRFTKQSRSLHGWSMWFRCRSLVSRGLFLFFLFLYSPLSLRAPETHVADNTKPQDLWRQLQLAGVWTTCVSTALWVSSADIG